ncbi:MAG: P-loop NTPase, partial [Planctomycetota bacterium]
MADERNPAGAAGGDEAAAGGDEADATRHATKHATGSAGPQGGATVQPPGAGGALPGVKHVIAVGAGKGGVGKSTIALLAAVGLLRRGRAAALLDADVYGPSLPKLTGTEDHQLGIDDQGRVLPVDVPFESADVRTPEASPPAGPAGDTGSPGTGSPAGSRSGPAVLKLVSMGHLIGPEQAVIWRGPMAQKYVKEFLERTHWGELEYLFVDLPPGTGDIPLTLAQSIPLTGAVIVCTPQPVALLDAVRALRMYQKL